MPSLKPGDHRLAIELDTNTILGTLKAERTVKIEDPAIGKLAADYVKVRKAGDDAKAASLRKKLLSLRFDQKIEPGECVPVDQPAGLDDEAPEGYSAEVRWYADKDRLRAVVVATDPNYASGRNREERINLGSVAIFVCPSGADQDICMVYAGEGPAYGEGMSAMMRGGKYTAPEDSPVVVSWWPTPTGYKAEIKIPYSELPGCDKNWSVMPVQIKLATRGDRQNCFLMAKPGDPQASARSYSLLRRK